MGIRCATMVHDDVLWACVCVWGGGGGACVLPTCGTNVYVPPGNCWSCILSHTTTGFSIWGVIWPGNTKHSNKKMPVIFKKLIKRMY